MSVDLRTDLDKLAGQIAKKAAQDATSLQESVDALKALTPYYALTQKLAAKSGDDETDGATFEAFSAQLVEPQEDRPNGRSPQVRSRRRDS